MATQVRDDPDHKQYTKPITSSCPQSKSDYQHPNPVYKNAREYAQALRPWLWQYYSCIMHSNLAFQCQLSVLSSGTGALNNNYFSPASGFYLSQRLDSFPGRRSQSPVVQNGSLINQTRQGQQSNGQGLQGGVVLKIPTFWKRVAAELIDFTFLFYIKMIVSLFLVTELSLDHISLFSRDDILETFSEMDYNHAFAITFEVIALEIVNRVLITIFETLCLYRTHGARGVVGATPGKRLMGLKVVSCDSVQGLGQGQVLVLPAGNISLKNAFLRSVIKNFTIAFFLPACLTLFFFSHNRTAYDIVAHTIVVEDA